MVDNTAVQGEDKWRGGLLRRDFSEKPSFTVLDSLINHEWRTRLNGKTPTGEIAFRGFHGSYKITIRRGRHVVERRFVVSKKGTNRVEVIL